MSTQLDIARISPFQGPLWFPEPVLIDELVATSSVDMSVELAGEEVQETILPIDTGFEQVHLFIITRDD